MPQMPVLEAQLCLMDKIKKARKLKKQDLAKKEALEEEWTEAKERAEEWVQAAAKAEAMDLAETDK